VCCVCLFLFVCMGMYVGCDCVRGVCECVESVVFIGVFCVNFICM